MSSGWGTVAQHPALAAVAGLDAALDGLAEANLWSLSPAELRELDRPRPGRRPPGRGDPGGDPRARRVRCRRRDRRGLDAGWLRGACRVDPRTATRDLRLAEDLAGPLTATGTALAAGRSSVEHARVIADTVHRLPGRASSDLHTEAETWLIDQARTFDPHALSRLARHLRHVTHPDGDGEVGSVTWRRSRPTCTASAPSP